MIALDTLRCSGAILTGINVLPFTTIGLTDLSVTGTKCLSLILIIGVGFDAFLAGSFTLYANTAL